MSFLDTNFAYAGGIKLEIRLQEPNFIDAVHLDWKVYEPAKQNHGASTLEELTASLLMPFMCWYYACVCFPMIDDIMWACSRADIFSPLQTYNSAALQPCH